ncbi:MAG: DegQ family serine endoprotease [Deltaproteobacteria bacterium]|nr:DegQ family serine endoprotease [Deltaproteobacteria bacterium]
MKNFRLRAFVTVLAVFMLGSFFAVNSVLAQDNGIENLRNTGRAFASVAKRVSPAVVFIRVEKDVAEPNNAYPQPFNNDLFRRFFGTPFPYQRMRPVPRRHPKAIAQGSGFIISRDGYIVTNNHVVAGADKITVRLQDQREFTAKVIGADKRADVALLKIDAKNLATVPLGDSDKLEVGEWVIAIGNPFGLSHSITAGIVSAKGRNSVGINDYEDFIQTDAAINPGNSGGPLVNLDGEVVGMNTAIFSKSGGYMGIGFAIPVNMIKVIEKQLQKNGSVTRGYMGVMIQQLTPELAAGFGMKREDGVLISQVMDGSAAAKAGMKRGDVVIKFAGKKVHNVGNFRNRVALLAPGTDAKVTVIRHGKVKKLTIVLDSLPTGRISAGGSGLNLDKLGFAVQNIDPRMARKYGYAATKGVMVTTVQSGSVAAMAGIKPGSLILEVNRQPVTNVQELQKYIGSKKDSVLLLIRGDRGSRFVVLKVD